MVPLNHMNNSLTNLSKNIHSTTTKSSIYHIIKKINTKTKTRQQYILTTITTASFYSNISSFSSSTSITQHQQISFEEPYSVKTGIKTAAILGGMLLFVVLYVLWKARSHFRFCSSSSIGNRSRLSGKKFDLDYWLKQVDLVEAKEAERNREYQSPYLQLPHEEPRDNKQATASWISDVCRQCRLIQYRQQHQLFRQQNNPNQQTSSRPTRRRYQLIRRFIRRLYNPSNRRSSFLIEYSPALISDMRPSIVNENLIPSVELFDVKPRRVASWPRLKSMNYQNGPIITSALQTYNTRKRLLKRTSQTSNF